LLLHPRDVLGLLLSEEEFVLQGLIISKYRIKFLSLLFQLNLVVNAIFDDLLELPLKGLILQRCSICDLLLLQSLLHSLFLFGIHIAALFLKLSQ